MQSVIREPHRGPDVTQSLALPLRRPQSSAALGTAIWVLADVFLACIVGLWASHGGVLNLNNGWLDAWLSISQVTGLLASGCGLVGVVLIARPRAIERHVGLDRMFVWHRYLGEGMALLLGVHIVSSVIAGTADGTGLWAVIRNYTGEPVRLPHWCRHSTIPRSSLPAQVRSPAPSPTRLRSR